MRLNPLKMFVRCRGVDTITPAAVRKGLLTALLLTAFCSVSVFAIVRDGRWVRLLYPDLRLEDGAAFFASDAVNPVDHIPAHPPDPQVDRGWDKNLASRGV